MSQRKPIRVMHVVQSLEVGGLENGVVNLLNRLNDERFSHVICCLTHAGKLAERIDSMEVKLVEAGLRTDRFRFPIIRLRSLVRHWMPDIVHTRGWGAIDAIIAARLAGVPRVIHGEHGREAEDPEGINCKRKVVRRTLSPLVDRFITVSDDLMRWLTNTVGIAAYKVVRIHNGVDIRRFSPEGRDEARRTLGLDGSVIAIGTVGRLDPVKDHRTLLRAFASLQQGNRSIRLFIVGDGPGREEIKSQIQQLGIANRVELLGERHDVADLLKAFDIFTLTSIAEGISNTILEAMACGLPVVATYVGGNPELVENEVSGQLVTAGDVQAITAAFQVYIDAADLRRDHGQQARLKVEQDFSLERMAQQYGELYENMTGGTVERAG
jgi:sugar transferase (PEP-CTERM/EpsH1 system associated)